MTAKYRPLENYLKNKASSHVPMSFSDIEAVIEGRLPASARKHRAWWSNNPSNSVITHSWLAAGYKTAKVSLEGETVVFVRRSEPATPPRSPSARDGGHPALGCMKGTVTVPAGTDPTDPAMPEWAAMTTAPDPCDE